MENPSFSYKAKEEMISRINTREKADVCLMGILTFCNVLSDEEIMLLTEHVSVAEFFKKNCERICGGEAVEMTSAEKRRGVMLYTLTVPKHSDRMSLLEYFRMDSSRRLTKDDLPKARYYPQLIAGIFLACGSVNDPEKKYHMEFVMPHIQLCNDFGLLLLDNYSILAKQTERKKAQIVYVKESDNIIDLLTIMGATNCSLEFINAKMMKELRNKINRAVNCDNANIEKTLRAAEKQVADIEYIEETVGLAALPETLREMAELRYENPDISLKDLGTLADPPISRSGVNHRLARIAEFADKLRREENRNKAP